MPTILQRIGIDLGSNENSVLVLLLMFMSESFSVTMMSPYARFMVQDFEDGDSSGSHHGPPHRMLVEDGSGTGYGFGSGSGSESESEAVEFTLKVGAISGTYAFCLAISSYPWGRIADRIGRKPVLIWGLIANTVFIILFGFSGSYAWALIMRGLNGLFNGNQGIVRTVMRELTEQNTQGQAFSITGVTLGIGMTAGPLIGGYLSEPADKYPRTFTGQVWSDYPYLLPSIFAAGLNIAGILLGLWLLPETLRTRSEQIPLLGPDGGTPRAKADTIDTEAKENPRSPGAIWKQIKDWPAISDNIKLIIKCNFIMIFIIDALAQMFPVWAGYSIAKGGLNFGTDQLGDISSVLGITLIAWQILFFARVEKAIGAVRMLQIAMLSMVPCVWLIPQLNLLVEDHDQLMWFFLLLLYVARGIAGNTGYIAADLLSSNEAPEETGSLQGVFWSIQALSSAISPMVGATIMGYASVSDAPYPFNVSALFVFLGLVGCFGFYMTLKCTSDMNVRAELREANREDARNVNGGSFHGGSTRSRQGSGSVV